MGFGWIVVLCLLGPGKQLVTGDQLPTCHPKDFHYEYTECDSDGGRWRVSVPKPDTCIGGAPNPPVRGKDCSFTCSAGEYLDLNGDQTCQPCPAGTYSLGGGVRFDDWETIPNSFSVTSEGLESSFLWSGEPSVASGNCTKMMWKARGDYIFAKPGACTTTLTYSTKLVKAGQVTFEYQYTDPETIFHFIVQNDQCQAAEDENSSRWPDGTEEGKWSSTTVSLKSGTNILQWRVIGALSDRMGGQSPVLIRKIEVTGVAFSSQCTKCRNGTYSSGGTAFCAACDTNKFSARGAAQCQSCQPDQYSEPGSAVCKKRPPCTKYDYYESQMPCDHNKQTRKIYRWIEPRVCNDKASGSVALPPATSPKSCPPCNPGMAPLNTSHCQFCAEGFYSDGRVACKACPVSTSPVYGLEYQWWTVLPPNISTHCVPLGSGKCSNNAGWLPAGDHVMTSFGSTDRTSFLVLGLKVDGFRGHSRVANGKDKALGKVTFTFEVNCPQDCELVFMSDTLGRNTVVQSWTGSVKRQEFTYDIHSRGPVALSWAFQPISFDTEEEGEIANQKSDGKGAEDKLVGLGSVAKIYNIKITNTIGGGASQCQACPKGTSNKQCVPCPDGQYIDRLTAQCLDCPPNTVLPSGNSWGKEACQPCGPGLKAVGRRECRSDCRYLDEAGRVYDFTALDGVHFVQGGRLFTSSGTMYYHGFNLTLCNANDADLPVCVNNVTMDTQKKGSKNEGTELINRNAQNMPGKVTGMICRSTLIPQSDAKKRLVATQPVSLATQLTKIVSNVSLADLYSAGGFETKGSELDVHFYYKSESATLACPNGRTTIISLHCDPDEKANNSIHLPPKCSDGTCDGCTFHFLWRTQHACPRCRHEDYEVIRGECVKGEQLIHYYPPKHCLPLDERDIKPSRQKCQTLPFAVMVAIPVTLGVGLLLILLLIYCWSRNKTLEYKYCKLVESAGGADGELPGVESCGMEEGEEDEAVHFSNSKGPRLLQKIRLKISNMKNKFTMEELSPRRPQKSEAVSQVLLKHVEKKNSDDEDNPFVAVQMHEKLSPT